MLRWMLGILGLAGVVIALPLLFAGGSLYWTDAILSDAEGFIHTPKLHIEVDGYALVAGPAGMDGLPDLPQSPVELGEIATLRVNASNLRDGLFIGIASSDAVETYLGGVPYAVMDESSTAEGVFLTYRMNEARETLASPAEQPFWTLSADGVGPLQLEWAVDAEESLLVIMNDDASDGVGVEATVGVRIPLLTPVSVSLLIGGGITLALGTLLLTMAL